MTENQERQLEAVARHLETLQMPHRMAGVIVRRASNIPEAGPSPGRWVCLNPSLDICGYGDTPYKACSAYDNAFYHESGEYTYPKAPCPS